MPEVLRRPLPTVISRRAQDRIAATQAILVWPRVWRKHPHVAMTLGVSKCSKSYNHSLTEAAGYQYTAYPWNRWKKYGVMLTICVTQLSMNFNAAIYSSAVKGINQEFGIDNSRLGMVAFLVAYAFGCELWAPWSEELGRRGVMQLSLSLVNASILICALSPSFAVMIIGRVFGGLASAGGSVTLGMVADMYHQEDQQFPVLVASLFSCLGAVVGGITGGPLSDNLDWRWIFWAQLIFSVVAQLVHGFFGYETRTRVLLKEEADRRGIKELDSVPYARLEVREGGKRWDVKKMLKTIYRPYRMLLLEPIVLCLSLLSGFADALIFMFFESYGIVFRQWDFSDTRISLVLIALAVSYIVAAVTFIPWILRDNRRRLSKRTFEPETKLDWLLPTVLCLPLGLLGSAFLATKSWIGVVAFTVPIGIANFAIYYATIDYMVAAYGIYAASATGGNGFCRDFLAGVSALYTKPMFTRLGIRNTYFLLTGLAVALCIPVYLFRWKGPQIRAWSSFAQKIEASRERQEVFWKSYGRPTGGVLVQSPSPSQATDDEKAQQAPDAQAEPETWEVRATQTDNTSPRLPSFTGVFTSDTNSTALNPSPTMSRAGSGDKKATANPGTPSSGEAPV
ncbi:MFS general substrate transporter [Sporormia fimetaria CBS 119925]|uniref:MFS general substrate transporter n=1 Tax=Sporormia fimetaria CBS 119925 TaxID=1340428 RepID=A0A6A6VK58_9PLEO|nr:MFS general substrate transporter [Sporormia fimetaria CBS 119925]